MSIHPHFRAELVEVDSVLAESCETVSRFEKTAGFILARTQTPYGNNSFESLRHETDRHLSQLFSLVRERTQRLEIFYRDVDDNALRSTYHHQVRRLEKALEEAVGHWRSTDLHFRQRYEEDKKKWKPILREKHGAITNVASDENHETNANHFQFGIQNHYDAYSPLKNIADQSKQLRCVENDLEEMAKLSQEIETMLIPPDKVLHPTEESASKFSQSTKDSTAKLEDNVLTPKLDRRRKFRMLIILLLMVILLLAAGAGVAAAANTASA